MGTIEGIIVIVFIVGVFTILALNIVRSDRIEPEDRCPPPPLWTTFTSYGPMCPSVEISGERRAKLCTLEARHSGECRYKVIDLEVSERRDEVL